jgi:hypothetical protein
VRSRVRHKNLLAIEPDAEGNDNIVHLLHEVKVNMQATVIPSEGRRSQPARTEVGLRGHIHAQTDLLIHRTTALARPTIARGGLIKL